MNLHVIKHPLVKHKLTLLRAKNCDTCKFRQLTRELSSLMAYEATQDFELENFSLNGWNGSVQGQQIKGKKVTLVPILRAGLGMLDGCLDLLPNAKISVVGLYRNEKTLEPVPYFEKFVSDIKYRTALILDPMLATGGSILATIDLLKQKGCQKIKVIVLVAAPEGVQRIYATHPDIPIYAASLDDCLNKDYYIVPGLGDAGDKIFGTKVSK